MAASDGEERVAVIGTQMAAARAAEERHQAGRDDGSALLGIAYDASAGELRLDRFVETATDRLVAAFAARYASLPPEEKSRERDSLRMDDFYTLLAFVRRSVLVALRDTESASLDSALTALIAIDQERVDSRDVAWAAALLDWAMLRTGHDAATAFRKAAAMAEPGVAKTLNRFADNPVSDLGPWGQQLVLTPDGPVLASAESHPYNPTLDLFDLATTLEPCFAAGGYRTTGITVGTEIPKVWLTPTEDRRLQVALSGLLGCALVNGTLESAAPSDAGPPGAQVLMAWLAQTAEAAQAETIARAVASKDSPDGGGYQAIGIAVEQVCCVLVARSWQRSVPSHEKNGSLERFRSDIQSALQHAPPRKPT